MLFGLFVRIQAFFRSLRSSTLPPLYPLSMLHHTIERTALVKQLTRFLFDGGDEKPKQFHSRYSQHP